MATPKNKPTLQDTLREQIDRIDRQRPVLDERYYVAEFYPAYTESGYYGQYVPARYEKVSNYFPFMKDCEMWAETMNPAPGATFVVMKQQLREALPSWWSPHRVKDL